MKINDVNDSIGYATFKERDDQVERNELETSPLLLCVKIRGEKIKVARHSKRAKFKKNKVSSLREGRILNFDSLSKIICNLSGSYTPHS